MRSLIVIVFPTDLNIDNAKKLSRSTFLSKENERDRLEIQTFKYLHASNPYENLIIFNVNADGDFQKGSVGWLVDKLHEKGVLEHVKNIYLIVSNLSKENPLDLYAYEMANYIDEKYKKIVYVHVPNAIGQQFTIIIPPTKTE